MVIFYVVLGNCAVVPDPLLGKEVCRVGLLQQGIAHVLLISEDLVDGTCVPFFFTGTGENAIGFKPGGYFIHAGTLKVLTVNAFYNFRLLRINDKLSIIALCVSEKAITVDGYLSLLVTVLQAEFHVLAERLTFLLGYQS